MERSEVQLKDQFDAFREALGEYVSPDTWNKITLRAWELMGVDLWNHVGCGCKVCRDCDPLTSNRMANLLRAAHEGGSILATDDLETDLRVSVATGGPTILRAYHEGRHYPLVIFGNVQQELDTRDKWDEIRAEYAAQEFSDQLPGHPDATDNG